MKKQLAALGAVLMLGAGALGYSALAANSETADTPTPTPAKVKIPEEFTGIAVNRIGEMLYYENGEPNSEFVGIVWPKDSKEGYWVAGGRVYEKFTGSVPTESGRYYVENGVITGEFSGYIPADGRLYSSSMLDVGVTGLVEAEDGGRYFVTKGELDKEAAGMMEFGGDLCYVNKGKWDTKFHGLCKFNDEWFYVDEGLWDTEYEGLWEHKDKLYYIKKGTIDKDTKGLLKIDDSYYYFKKGKVDTDYDGIAERDDGRLYYLHNGELDEDMTGVVENDDDELIYFENGRQNTDYEGVGWCEERQTNFYVVDGVVDREYDGEIEWDGIMYKVHHGIIGDAILD